MKLTVRMIVDTLAQRGIHITPETVRRWIKTGSMVGFRVGGRLYADPAELERFLGNSHEPEDADHD